MLERLEKKLEFIFSNPERRFAFVTTLTVAISIGMFLMLDTNSVARIFYRPDQSMVSNLISFVAIMCSCFMFGFVMTRILMWVRSGSFRAPKTESTRKRLKAK